MLLLCVSILCFLLFIVCCLFCQTVVHCFGVFPNVYDFLCVFFCLLFSFFLFDFVVICVFSFVLCVCVCVLVSLLLLLLVSVCVFVIRFSMCSSCFLILGILSVSSIVSSYFELFTISSPFCQTVMYLTPYTINKKCSTKKVASRIHPQQ